MARRLLLVRHARIVAASTGRLIGATDAPLDAEGLRQAGVLAERVRRWSPDCYCSSPMERCRQTVAAIAGSTPVQFDDDLREIDFGRCEGRTFAEVAREDASLAGRWAALDDDFAFPGGERLGGFLERVRGAVDRLARLDVPTVLAVTHGGVIRSAICHLLGLEPRHYLAFDVTYAATVAIDLFDGRGVLAAMEPLDPAASKGDSPIFVERKLGQSPTSAEGRHG